MVHRCRTLQFQFHKGTIRTLSENQRPITEVLFQFHKGTIRTSKKPITSAILKCFNSIKVRLEQLGRKVVEFVVRFQFHKGTIRTGDLVLSGTSVGSFNSIKVRLERFPTSVSCVCVQQFQFHKGTIRTLFPI